jgi:ATP-dependent helicase/nuclease subunit B
METSIQTLVLTANRRLAETIRRSGVPSQSLIWQTPRIIPLHQWLQTLWRSHPLSTELLLHPYQEQQLWRRIVSQISSTQYPLLHLDNTVQLIQQAWQLLHDWQIPLSTVKQYADSAENELFIRCAEQFHALCQQQGYISEALLPQRIQALLHQQHLTVPPQILIVGFDELPPAYLSVIDTLRSLSQVTEKQKPAVSAHCHSHIYPDLDHEITAMAQWAKRQLAHHPQQRLGCVVPQLTQCRAAIARIFKQVFPVTPIFTISAAQNLDEFAPITIALQALGLRQGQLPMDSLGQLLQSPYLCQNESDFHLGAQIDAQCRRLRRYELSTAVLFKTLAKWQPDYPQQTWLTRWRAFAAITSHETEAQPPSAWADCFSRRLIALGWPGGRALNSLEYQVIQRWQELLVEFAELDAVIGAIDHHEAHHLLQRLAAQTPFQPESALAPVQILGVLESSGIEFDALWIMGLDDQHWPPPPHPNPFLPYTLQIQRQMPHACVQREFAYTQQITQRLLNSAPEIWLSCCADTQQPARFSRLLNTVNVSTDEENQSDTFAEKIFASRRTEMWDDPQGPPVGENEIIRGGSSILTQQAECPFRAFATFRLQATGLETPALGIHPTEHGILMHDTLDRLWKKLKNQDNLIAMSPDELTQLLEQIVSDVINDTRQSCESAFIEVEKNRLLCLVQEWLTLEKQRPSFQVVFSETAQAFTIGRLSLQLKMDRIDQLSDGSYLLLDYKTGQPNAQGWLQERLQQPQLPLYTLAFQHQGMEVCGVAFAQLHAGQLGFKGFHTEALETSDYFPRGLMSIAAHTDLTAPRTWTDLCTHWRQALEKLSDAFYRGDAAVDPASPDTCKHCDLQALCRIHQREAQHD